MSRDLIVIGTHPFTPGVPLGDWHLARALGRRHRVLWVDPPVSPLAARRGVASTPTLSGRPRPGGDGVLVGTPVVPSGRPLPRISRIIDRLVVAQINRWVRMLAMSPVDVISFAPRFGALPGLRRRLLAAWLKDRDWAGVDVGHPTWLRARQAELVAGADVVSGVSAVLVEDCRRLGVGAVRIPNGCDVARYVPHREPSAWLDIPSPRVVFAGAWNERVDTALVGALAAELSGISFVVVGEVRATLPDATNVYALGAVGFDELPAHLQAADVGIVPYRRDRFNAATCPLKVYEYLAAGLPVVATAVDTGDLPADVVRHADGAAAFARAVEELALADLADRCRAVAAANSWDARADALLGELDRG